MEKEYSKEVLNTSRAERTMIWNTILLVTGGSIGVYFRLLTTGGKSEFIFLIIGVIYLANLINANRRINIKIRQLLQKMKEEK